MAVKSPTEKRKCGLRYSSSKQEVVEPKQLLVYFYLLLLLLLLLMQSAEGILHNTTRLEQVESFSKQELKICIQPLSQKPKALMAARLMVQSTANKNVFTAGNVTFWGISQNNWHTITIESTTSDYKHILNATMDSEAIPFNNVSTKMWTSSFKFKEILLLTKGAIEIEDCPPQDLSIKTTTTEATTTLFIEESSTSTKPTTTASDSKGTTPPPSTAPPEDGSWYLSLGKVGSVPTLLLVIGLLLAIVLVASIILCWRKMRETKNSDRKLHDPRYKSVHQRDNQKPIENDEKYE